MISKNKIKYIRGLEKKKVRDAEGVFIAEGVKLVNDILERFPSYVQTLVATSEWFESNEARIKGGHLNCELIQVEPDELKKVSLLCHPQSVLAVFRKLPSISDFDISEKLTLVLDSVQDPGNMGTIVRIADWFGIENIICSPTCADVYNPKVVQATMGSISRVNVSYMPLCTFFDQLPPVLPIYGTLLDGDNINEVPLTKNGIIVMGNEGNGISPEIRKRITHALRIPSFPPYRDTVESLNVAIATAIVCADFRK